MDTEAQPAPETVTASDDVHSDVRAAIESLTSKQDAPEPTTHEAPSAERVRDETGKFAKADTAQPEVARTVPDADPNEGKTLSPSPVVEAPNSWSAPAKAKWATLDPSIQAEIVRREQNMHEGGQKWSDEKRRYEETLAPVREAARKSGIDEQEGLKRLLAAQDYLDRDPANAIQWLAKAYGVDLQNPNASQPSRPQADPVLTQLHQEVSHLKNDLERREQKEIQSTIEAFKSAPGHEHFEDVKETMGKLLMNELAEDMEDAYQKAVWQTSSVREKLIAAQTAPANAVDKTRQQADKAKKAAISLNGSPVTGAAPAPKRDYETVDEAARAAARQHGWAV